MNSHFYGLSIPNATGSSLNENLRCTALACGCTNFTSASANQRLCNECGHGWVTHAVDKLLQGIAEYLIPEPLHVDIVFDVASLILYGSQAVPIKLKILLDKLFAKLRHNEVLQIIFSLNWPYEDYVRGYKYKDGHMLLTSWVIATVEEERTILQHFTKFADTRDAASQFIKLMDRPLDYNSQKSDRKNNYQSSLKGIIAAMHKKAAATAAGVNPVPDVRKVPLLAPRVVTVPFDESSSDLGSSSLSKTQIVNPFLKSTNVTAISDFSGSFNKSSPVTTLSNPRISIEERPMSKLMKRPYSANKMRRLVCSSCPRWFSSQFMYKLHQNLHHQDNSARNPPRKKVNLKNRKIKTKLTRFGVTGTDLTSMGHFSLIGDESKESGTSASLLSCPKEASLISPVSSQLGGGGLGNELENLQSLVAHLDRKDDPLTTLESPLIEKAGSSISPPPNASIEVGPGGSMVPMLRPRSAISSSVGTCATSTSSSETSTAGVTTSSGGSVEYENEIPTLGETVDGIICGICCKTYKNRTCLKQHYNNVHLRLQHYCWIKGCNMSFPSKRSRDRHSLNFNLHCQFLQAEGSVMDFSNSNSQSDLTQQVSSGSPDSSESIYNSITETSLQPAESPTLTNCAITETSESYRPSDATTNGSAITPKEEFLVDENQSAIVWPKAVPFGGFSGI